MQTQWGRKESIIFPPHSPMYSYGAIFVSVMLTGLFLYLHFAFTMSPLQRFYLPYYFRTAVAGTVHRTDKYQMLMVADGAKRSRAARDNDVIAGSTAQIGEKPIPMQLSEFARASGLEFLYRGPNTEYLNRPLHNYFQKFVYDDETALKIFRLPLLFGVASLFLQLPFSIRKDIKRYKEIKYGRRLKGPVLVSPKEFNKAVQGDGIGFKTLETEAMMRVPSGAEGQHIELMGDTGAGKTTLIMQLLRQIQSRGDSAIIYDPACEFIQRFYDKDRTDIILNPLDARCPYWGPSEELRRRAEAKAIAASLYQPTTDRKGEFFVETPQKIFAHLLTFGPTPQELVQQRNGVLAIVLLSRSKLPGMVGLCLAGRKCLRDVEHCQLPIEKIV
jgi:hypothetical protein